MKKTIKINRREFLKKTGAMGLEIGSAGILGSFFSDSAKAQQPDLRGKVVHIQDAAATSFDFSQGWCGDAISQKVVNRMVQQALLELTATSSIPSAWKTLIPDYTSGKKFAIKVNFNNYRGRVGQDVNSFIEPVNALIGTLIDFGADPKDILVFDVTNGRHRGQMPKKEFIDRCLYPGVRFTAYTPGAFSENQKVKFSVSDIPELSICEAVVESDYLINMPYVKFHITHFVTLAFKNHFGSIDRCDLCHAYNPNIRPSGSSYSPLVDIYKNPHFQGKTVLTIGDFLFGVWHGTPGVFPPKYEARPWKTFGNKAPNSLIFATDPVAIDSLMADFISAERQAQGLGPLDPRSWDYLKAAEAAGLGLFEHGDPRKEPYGSGYRKVKYHFVTTQA